MVCDDWGVNSPSRSEQLTPGHCKTQWPIVRYELRTNMSSRILRTELNVFPFQIILTTFCQVILIHQWK
jgi:hypothetical protein